jgi:hypothetical protein
MYLSTLNVLKTYPLLQFLLGTTLIYIRCDLLLLHHNWQVQLLQSPFPHGKLSIFQCHTHWTIYIFPNHFLCVKLCSRFYLVPSFYLFILWYWCLCWGLALARQVLYSLSQASSLPLPPFFFNSFIHMCIHCLGHFSTLPPKGLSLLSPRMSGKTVVPFCASSLAHSSLHLCSQSGALEVMGRPCKTIRALSWTVGRPGATLFP